MNKKNVIMIVVDCGRRDAVFGESNAKTPFLDSLRENSVVFNEAVSVCSTTVPCFTSILTGRYSFGHGLRTMYGFKKNPEAKSLAEAFKEKGYNTFAEFTGPVIEGVGLEAGFDEFNIRGRNDVLYTSWGKELSERIGKLPEPFFLLIHIWMLHRPRYLSEDFNNPLFGNTAYERSLSCLDSYLGKLYDSFPGNTSLVLLADHGEFIPKNKVQEYFNHLKFAFFFGLRTMGFSSRFTHCEGHGHNIMEEAIRIPLLFSDKDLEPCLIDKQVSQVDIAPTLASLFELDLGKKVHGHNLVPLMKGELLENYPVFIECCGIKGMANKTRVEGIRSHDLKYEICTTKGNFFEKVYRIENGKDVELNLKENQGLLEKMRKDYDEIKEEGVEEKMVDSVAKKKLMERLRKLGYM